MSCFGISMLHAVVGCKIFMRCVYKQVEGNLGWLHLLHPKHFGKKMFCSFCSMNGPHRPNKKKILFFTYFYGYLREIKNTYILTYAPHILTWNPFKVRSDKYVSIFDFP